jgi:hypothetical protein
MKKMIFCAVMLMGVSTAFVGCKKDSVENGCTCTVSYMGRSETKDFTADEVKAEGYSSCSAIAADAKKELKEEGMDGVSVSCKGK